MLGGVCNGIAEQVRDRNGYSLNVPNKPHPAERISGRSQAQIWASSLDLCARDPLRFLTPAIEH